MILTLAAGLLLRRDVLFAGFVANAGDFYYTEEEFCLKSDAENPSGIDFGCEQYASAEKKVKMRRRALDDVSEALARLDNFTISSNGRARILRAELRAGALGSLRRQAKRLAALDPGLSEAMVNALAAVDRLDNAARRLELDDDEETRRVANAQLDAARASLGVLIDQAG